MPKDNAQPVSAFFSLGSLSQDLQSNILDYLPLIDVISLSTTAHRMRNTIAEHESYWKRKLDLHFPHQDPDADSQCALLNYKQLFGKYSREDYKHLNKKQKKLFLLVKDGDLENLKKETIQKSDLQVKDKSGHSGRCLVDWCIQNKYTEISEYLFECSYTMQDEGDSKHDDSTVIAWAIWCNATNNLQRLLEKNQKISLHCFSLAVELGRLACVKMLLQKDRTLLDEELDNNGNCALFLAIQKQHSDVAIFLLNQGADVSTSPNHLHDDYVSYALSEGLPEVAQVLLTKDENLFNLGWAARFGDLEKVKESLEQNDTLLEEEFLGNKTALWLAIEGGHSHVATFLIENGAEFRTDKTSCFHYAASQGLLDVIKALLAKDKDLLDETDWHNETALMHAARTGQREIVQYLLAHGANTTFEKSLQNTIDYPYEEFTNREEDAGKTALAWAVTNNHSDVAMLLINHGADLTVRFGNDGNTCLHAAASNGLLPLVDALLEKDNTLLETIDLHGGTALFCATCSGKLNVVNALLDKGANVNARSTQGLTALYIAAASKHNNIVQALIARGADVDLAVKALSSITGSKKEIQNATTQRRRNIAALYNQLGHFHFEQDRYREAEHAYTQAVNTLEENVSRTRQKPEAKDKKSLDLYSRNRDQAKEKRTDACVSKGIPF